MSVDINKLTEQQKDVISGVVQYRFYHRITERNVYEWLNNFKQDEVDLALEILKHVDYYREDDIISILQGYLKDFVNKKRLQLHFIPVGSAGKSGQMFVYIIQGVLKPYYSKRHRFHYYKDISGLNVGNLTKNDVIFFVDDVVGSGNTFLKYVKDNPVIRRILDVSCPAIKRLLCIVATLEGKKRINTNHPTLKVIAEEKLKVFDISNSCFGSYYKMLPIREFAYKYGHKLEHSKTKALGYENSQLLTVFSHTVPNNTLPIIWKHTEKYTPLVPRSYAEKGEKAFMERNETNRWVFFFLQFFQVNKAKDAAKIFHDKYNFAIMTMLRMKIKGLDEVLIANLMGLHHQDMEILWDKGVMAGLWDKKHIITAECQKRYEEMMKLLAYENTKYSKVAPHTDAQQIYLYMPETFRGQK